MSLTDTYINLPEASVAQSVSMEQFKPKVSIIIPVYNGSQFVGQAITSALNQTYPNCEILVVNDGSKDGGKSAEVVKSFGDRVTYFEKPNGGVACALNFGISKATGQYFSWLSHDDLYYPTKVELQVRTLEGIPAEERGRTIVYGDFREVDQSGEYLGRAVIRGKHPEWKLNHSLYPLVNGLIHGCTLLIPLELLKTHGGFRTEFRTTQDYDCWSRIFPASRVVFVPKVLVQSRIHREQTSKTDPAKEREYRDFWSRVLNIVTQADMIQLEGSSESFQRKMSALVANKSSHSSLATVSRRGPVVRFLKVLGFSKFRTWMLKIVDP